MAIKKNGLGKGFGKGLDALIPDKISSKPKNENTGDLYSEKKVIEKEENNKSTKKTRISNMNESSEDADIAKDEFGKNVIIVKINDVEPNRNQPRKDFDEDALIELADSIRQFGVLQPLLVQKKGDFYEIIAGERRWRGAKLAGLKEIPVIVGNFSNQEVLEISLIENIQRENLNPIEEAIAFKRLLEEFHLKQDEVAERVSKSRTAVTNSMRLLKLSEKVQQMIIDEMISTGHARALLAVDDENLQYSLAVRVFDEKLSVREIEKIVKDLKKENKKTEKNEIKHQFIYTNIENRLKTIIGTKVTVRQKTDDKGKIEIEYYSKEELERIYDLMLSIQGEEK